MISFMDICYEVGLCVHMHVSVFMLTAESCLSESSQVRRISFSV